MDLKLAPRSTAEWEGDWTGVHSWLTGLFPMGGLPGLDVPWPASISIRLGPKPEYASEVDVVEFDSEDVPDFATKVIGRLREILRERPESSTQATLGLRPNYSEGADPPPGIGDVVCTRTFTRQVQQQRQTVPGALNQLADPLGPLTRPSGPLGGMLPGEGGGAGGGGLGGSAPATPRPLPGDDPYLPHRISGGGVIDHTVFRTFQLLENQIREQREELRTVTGHLMGVLSEVVRKSSTDAERFSTEAAEQRRTAASVERKLIEISKERDILEDESDRLRDEVTELREELEEARNAEPKKKRRRRRPDMGNDFFQEVVGAAVAAIRREEQPAKDEEEEPPPRKPRVKPPGAPRAHPSPKRSPQAQQPPAGDAGGGGLGGLGGVLGMLGADGASTDQIADVVASLPSGMLDSIVTRLVRKHPEAAVNLGEKIAEETEGLIREAEGDDAEEDDDDDDGGVYDPGDDDDDDDDDDVEVEDEDEDEDEDEEDE